MSARTQDFGDQRGHLRETSYPTPIAAVTGLPTTMNSSRLAVNNQEYLPDQAFAIDSRHLQPTQGAGYTSTMTNEKHRSANSTLTGTDISNGNENGRAQYEKETVPVTPFVPLIIQEPNQNNDLEAVETASMIYTKKQMRALVIKNHFLAFVGEFVGTVLFMYFALGATNVANLPATTVTGVTTTSATTGDATTVLNTSSLLYIALAFGFSLAICAWIFFRVSGGLFNPAVSLGLALIGVITPFRAALLTLAQCLGAIAGAGFVQLTLPGDLNATTRLASDTSVVQGLFIEMFCTSLLMFAVLFLAAEKSKATFLAPIGIGLALFIGEMVGVLYTGGSLNPARSLGPNVILANFSKNHWIYWLGPAMGATLAAAFYKAIKMMHFETVVPGQDDDGSQAALIAQQVGPAGIASNGPRGATRVNEHSVGP